MRTREILKNLLIVVLLVGMAYLSVTVWTANDQNSGLFALFSSDAAESAGRLESPDVDAYPLSVSIKNEAGRYSAVYDDAATDRGYGQTESVLREAVKTAHRGKSVEQDVWEAALVATPSVLYDYQCDVPMSVLSFWYGREEQNVFAEYSVRYLCLATMENTVCLLGKDASGEKCFRFATDVSKEDFLGALSAFEPNDVSLAAELGEERYAEQLLSSEPPHVSELRAVNAANELDDDETDRLLKCFELNPNTMSRHVEQDGTKMFVEDISTVKISPSGVVTYTDLRTDLEYDTGLVVISGDESAAVWEKTETARELVSELDSFTASNGRLYLVNVQETGDTVEILFGRSVGGIPIDFRENRAAARVKIQGNRVTEVEFILRRYEVTEGQCVVLPSKLAASGASSSGAEEISLRYVDANQERVIADWYLK